MTIPYSKIERIYKSIVQNEHFIRISSFEETPDWFQELYHEAKRINERFFRIKRIVETK